VIIRVFKILIIQLKCVCSNAQTHDRWEILRSHESWPRSLTRASTLVNLTALARHETTVSRILADDGEPGGAKFRSPRRDAHKKDRPRHRHPSTRNGSREWAKNNEWQLGSPGLAAQRIFVSLRFAEMRTTWENTA